MERVEEFNNHKNAFMTRDQIRNVNNDVSKWAHIHPITGEVNKWRKVSKEFVRRYGEGSYEKRWKQIQEDLKRKRKAYREEKLQEEMERNANQNLTLAKKNMDRDSFSDTFNGSQVSWGQTG